MIDHANRRPSWYAIILFLLLVGMTLAAGLAWRNHNLAAAQERDQALMLAEVLVVDSEDIVTLLPADSIPSVDDPQFQPASEVAGGMAPDERVIGLVVNGDARAYPINILSSHEIVNDEVGGEPLAVTWCPLCYTALVFSRHVPGQQDPLTFGVSGKLLYNTLVMFDRQTNTLWSQLYGAAVDGPLAGAGLAVFPSLHTDWATWEALHPDSLVLSKELTRQQFGRGSYSENPRHSYDIDPYASYYNTPEEGVIDAQIPRDSFTAGAKERVLGVRAAGQARAYPYRVLKDQPVVNDKLDQVPVLIWFDPLSQTGTAFQRQVKGLVLTFEEAVEGQPILIDRETGSRWNPLSGRAIGGPLRGTQLPAVVSTTAFEFGWNDYYLDGDNYGSDR